MHTTKRAVLLSCSDHYNHRLYVIDGYLKSQGYETVYYTGDFDHSSKKVFHCSVPGCRQIHVRPYRKNLSLAPDPVTPGLCPAGVPGAGAGSAGCGGGPAAPQLSGPLRRPLQAPPPGYQADIRDLRYVAGDVPLRLREAAAGPAFSIWAGLRDKNLPAADRVFPSAGCSAASWACLTIIMNKKLHLWKLYLQEEIEELVMY